MKVERGTALVIGAGVIGTSIALELARGGRTALTNMYDLGIDVQRWTGDQVRAHFPAVDPARFGPPARPEQDQFWSDGEEPVDAYWMPECGFINDPQLAAHNLAHAARVHGATFRFRSAVVDTVGSLVELMRIPSVSGSPEENDIQDVLAGNLTDLGLEDDHWQIPLAETLSAADFPGVEVARDQAWGLVARYGGSGDGCSLMNTSIAVRDAGNTGTDFLVTVLLATMTPPAGSFTGSHHGSGRVGRMD